MKRSLFILRQGFMKLTCFYHIFTGKNLSEFFSISVLFELIFNPFHLEILLIKIYIHIIIHYFAWIKKPSLSFHSAKNISFALHPVSSSTVRSSQSSSYPAACRALCSTLPASMNKNDMEFSL